VSQPHTVLYACKQSDQLALGQGRLGVASSGAAGWCFHPHCQYLEWSAQHRLIMLSLCRAAYLVLQPWHVDDADLVGLLCLKAAKEGGRR